MLDTRKNHFSMIGIFLMLFTLFSPSVCIEPISIQLAQGYNTYTQLSHRFLNYEKVRISDLTSEQDGKQYHFCFIEQSEVPKMQISEKKILIEEESAKKQDKSQKVLFDLDEVIKMNKIIASYYNASIGRMFVLLSQEIKVIEILEGKRIGQVSSVEIGQKVKRGQFYQIDNNFFLMTSSSLYLIVQGQKGEMSLKLLNSTHKQDQECYLSMGKLGDQIWVFSNSTLSTYNQSADFSDPNLKTSYNKSISGLQLSADNSLNVYNFEKDDFVVYLGQDRVRIGYSLDFVYQQSVDQLRFYELPSRGKCTHFHQYQNYLFLQCSNHLLYLNANDIIQCNRQLSIDATQSCLNKVKTNHVNIGYHIQSIEFTSSKLIVTGIDKYEILLINSFPSIQLIQSITPIATYHTQSNINKVYLLNSNTSIILTKKTIQIGTHLPEVKEIYCKTIDTNSHQLLVQPYGKFNGNITIEGICQDSLIQATQMQKNQNSTLLCHTTVPFIVNIQHETKSYELIWYILLCIGAVIAIIGTAYCFIKKRKLNSQYRVFEDEREHGKQIAQKTMVTQGDQNQEQTAQN